MSQNILTISIDVKAVFINQLLSMFKLYIIDYDNINYSQLTFFIQLEDYSSANMGTALVTIHLDTFPRKQHLTIILTSPLTFVGETHIAQSRESIFEFSIGDPKMLEKLRSVFFDYRAQVLNEIALFHSTLQVRRSRTSAFDLFG